MAGEGGVAKALTRTEAGSLGGRGKKAADIVRSFDGPNSPTRIVARLKRATPHQSHAHSGTCSNQPANLPLGLSDNEMVERSLFGKFAELV
jgi:hypothetical protein